MALTDKLRNLDQKLLPGTREAEEDAESYLRRVAASRAITPAQAGDVMAALRQYFGVEQGESVRSDSSSDTDPGDEEQSEEPKAEASDESDESDESDDSGDSGDSEEDDDEG